MIIFPAIDLRGGNVVRLQKGDYDRMTVYGTDPLSTARGFKEAGAEYLHTVDLDGAKDGTNPNFSIIKALAQKSGLRLQVGGGIRNMQTIERYLDAGAWRVILGTAALTDPDFLEASVKEYGGRIAVGVDINNGFAATHGWTKVSGVTCFDFFERLQALGVQTVICTDISKDGLLQGTNTELYKKLSGKFDISIIASGGVTSLEDIGALMQIGVYGAILGKALYTGHIDLSSAVALAKGGASS